MGSALGTPFSSKAKLVARVTHTAVTTTYTFVIRDGNTLTDVTGRLEINFGPHVSNDRSYLTQSKGGGTPPVGNVKMFGYGYFRFKPNRNDIRVELQGSLSNTQRVILSKEVENTSFPLATISQSGTGTFALPPINSLLNVGVAQGSFKIVGPKIIKNN